MFGNTKKYYCIVGCRATMRLHYVYLLKNNEYFLCNEYFVCCQIDAIKQYNVLWLSIVAQYLHLYHWSVPIPTKVCTYVFIYCVRCLLAIDNCLYRNLMCTQIFTYNVCTYVYMYAEIWCELKLSNLSILFLVCISIIIPPWSRKGIDNPNQWNPIITTLKGKTILFAIPGGSLNQMEQQKILFFFLNLLYS